MSKHNPKNREEAFAHQFKDDADMLMKFALIPDSIGFKNTLLRMKLHIKTYESKSMQKAHKKALMKTAQREETMRKYAH